MAAELPENNGQNEHWKPSYINNYHKCKLTKFANKKAQSGRLDQKTKPNYVLPSRGTSMFPR